jgi:thiamine-phosphate pyrophosphorylase
MTSQGRQETTRPAPRLYLVTPAIADGSFARELSAAMDGADVAAVLLRLADSGERAQTDLVKSLAPIVQSQDAAVLLDGHAGLVARAGADGAHLTGIDGFEDAVAALKPDRIAGAGGLLTRHDAMLAAEAGADYAMFGEPDAQGHRPPFDEIVERVGWWAEVFRTPCVGFAASFDEIAPLAAAGADFVAVGDFIFADTRGPRAATAAAAALLAQAEPVP